MFFGNTTSSGAPSSNPFQFTEKENDGTGAYYYRARYYAPGLERFVSEDPLGAGGGHNVCAYADNDPLNYVDPFGLKRRKRKPTPKPPGPPPQPKPQQCNRWRTMPQIVYVILPICIVWRKLHVMGVCYLHSPRDPMLECKL